MSENFELGYVLRLEFHGGYSGYTVFVDRDLLGQRTMDTSCHLTLGIIPVNLALVGDDFLITV